MWHGRCSGQRRKDGGDAVKTLVRLGVSALTTLPVTTQAQDAKVQVSTTGPVQPLPSVTAERKANGQFLAATFGLRF